jgi:RNA polymerase sigma factor (sigma-70 family)
MEQPSDNRDAPPASLSTEDQLVQLAIGGDESAFEKLLLLHHDRLLRLIEQQLPLDVERVVSAEDVLQDTFTDAFRSVAGLRIASGAGFRAWIDRIARNRAINVRKSLRRLKRGGGAATLPLDERSVADADALLALLAARTRSPRQRMMDGEQIEQIRVAFATLPEDHRFVLRRRFLEHAEYGQIAAEMRRSIGAVKMIAMRALRDLREMLEDFSSSAA